ncbi:hypothetical protein IG631_12139 [Alternaria alternata]|jgi:predicted lipoprotein with Yx(FWY)xxD motif|nr:hypothetical protein IG631_12139 [Alternaria alternata]
MAASVSNLSKDWAELEITTLEVSRWRGTGNDSRLIRKDGKRHEWRQDGRPVHMYLEN